MQRLTRLKEEVERIEALDRQLTALADLIELATVEEDDSLQADIAAELERTSREIEALEIEVLLSGPYDDRDAFLSIKAGMGGTDAQDWAEMLLRMYMRWGERRGFQVALIDQSDGEEAGIKSATIELRGPMPTATPKPKPASTA